MKYPITQREKALARRISELTGRREIVCLYCLRRQHGNYKMALQMCSQSDDNSEGERYSYKKLAFVA
jgi:hypothetical protein